MDVITILVKVDVTFDEGKLQPEYTSFTINFGYDEL